MGFRELLVSQSNIFSGFQKPFEEADYVVIGVPFDATSTFRTGARFGPNAIREASLNIETYSFRSELDIEDVRLHDLGDLHISTSAEKTLENLSNVVAEMAACDKIPVVIGGEHTITFGVLKGFGNRVAETAVISFDAHLDLRDEFLGVKLSHTTFMRRIKELMKTVRVIEVGTRAVCKEEIEYAKKAGVDFITALQLKEYGSREAVKLLKEKIADFENVYLSIDMDVLDPAYAPAVQNPEPGGIDPAFLLDILYELSKDHIIGFDVVEVAPNYDNGISAIQAAKLIFEIICFIEKRRK